MSSLGGKSGWSKVTLALAAALIGVNNAAIIIGRYCRSNVSPEDNQGDASEAPLSFSRGQQRGPLSGRRRAQALRTYTAAQE